ncbi:MAG: hypothetical protein H6719_06665 [Sandaracinaceae bacterium]|nr:hypothetical protein [Sandaracinaceae bacterium]
MARAVPLFAFLLVACNRPPMAPIPSASRSVTATDITIDGAPPPEDFADVVRERTDEVLAPVEECYAERLVDRPGLEGEEQLRVYVSAAQVIRVTMQSSTLDDPILEDCVKQAILRYVLPEGSPRGGAFVEFRLIFRSSEG